MSAELLLRKAWSLLDDVEHVLRRADAADLADVAAGFATDVYDRMRLVEHGPSDTPEPAPTVREHGGSVEGSGARVEAPIPPRRPAGIAFSSERDSAFYASHPDAFVPSGPDAEDLLPSGGVS